MDGPQSGLLAGNGTGEIDEGRGGFVLPVPGELAVVVGGEVVGGSFDEEGLRKVKADAKATGIHRGLWKRLCGRGWFVPS
ncbi:MULTISPECIES: hypothetical protein [Streptomyces]|uniref:hypothetical protein n=1 Tax=Streptomyces TaxID=1883 RepID=UPI0009A55506|nr:MULTISPECIES: hypothetical protein [Streptomyces]